MLGAGAPGWAPLRVLSLSPRRWLPAQLLLAAAGWGSNEDTLHFRQSFPVPFPFLPLSFWCMSLDSLTGLVGHSAHRGLCRTGTGPGGSAVRELMGAGSLLSLGGPLGVSLQTLQWWMHSFVSPGWSCREEQFQMSLFGSVL